MTDEKAIAMWMEPEPQPVAGFKRVYEAGATWWAYCADEWEPAVLTLDALHLVEAKLSDDQWDRYEGLALAFQPRLRTAMQTAIHASADQKIRALAAVLRESVEKGKSDGTK